MTTRATAATTPRTIHSTLLSPADGRRGAAPGRDRHGLVVHPPPPAGPAARPPGPPNPGARPGARRGRRRRRGGAGAGAAAPRIAGGPAAWPARAGACGGARTPGRRPAAGGRRPGGRRRPAFPVGAARAAGGGCGPGRHRGGPGGPGGAGRAAGASDDTVGGGGRVSASTVVTDSGVAVPRSAATAMAAPKAMASLGWASMAMGRPSSAPTIWATSGMRDEPPTSRTALMSSDVAPRPSGWPGAGPRSSRRSPGRIIASNSAPGEPHLGLQAGQQHRDRHVGVGRQRLLGVDALLAQPGHRGLRGRLLGVEAVEAVAHRLAHVGEHRLVEVDAAQALDALGRCR